MAFPQKRVLFFLVAVLLIGASPAFAVPLSSGMDHQGAVAPSYTDPDGETALPADGSADHVPRAGIVDHKEVAMSTVSGHSSVAGSRPDMGAAGSTSADMGHSTPGWIVPAAAVAAGGGLLYAVSSHGHHGDSNASSIASSVDPPADPSGDTPSPGGSGGGTMTMGNDHGGTPGDNPPSVPEPGTLMLMGAGIASFLGRRKLLSR